MRIVWLQHDPGAQPGLLGEALADRGGRHDLIPMASSIHDPVWHDELPDIGRHDLVVPLGAVWSVYDHDRLESWIHRELAWLRQLDANGVPVLGVCFGGQALAAAHGGAVEAMGHSDIGWSTIDPIDASPIAAGPWMQWHGDRFLPPPDAEVLATAPVGVQAFTLRRNLGLQFHPEVTASIIDEWMTLGGAAAARAAHQVGEDPDALLATARAQQARARRDVDRMLDWWLPSVGLAPS